MFVFPAFARGFRPLSSCWHGCRLGARTVSARDPLRTPYVCGSERMGRLFESLRLSVAGCAGSLDGSVMERGRGTDSPTCLIFNSRGSPTFPCQVAPRLNLGTFDVPDLLLQLADWATGSPAAKRSSAPLMFLLRRSENKSKSITSVGTRGYLQVLAASCSPQLTATCRYLQVLAGTSKYLPRE
jgi:hypothetical protein